VLAPVVRDSRDRRRAEEAVAEARRKAAEAAAAARKRLLRWALGLATAAGIALLFFAFVSLQLHKTNEALRLAEKQSRLALSRFLAVKSVENREEHPLLAWCSAWRRSRHPRYP
jgi:uncharacterized protein HemX